jgi:hypothetical protein
MVLHSHEWNLADAPEGLRATMDNMPDVTKTKGAK